MSRSPWCRGVTVVYPGALDVRSVFAKGLGGRRVVRMGLQGLSGCQPEVIGLRDVFANGHLRASYSTLAWKWLPVMRPW